MASKEFRLSILNHFSNNSTVTIFFYFNIYIFIYFLNSSNRTCLPEMKIPLSQSESKAASLPPWCLSLWRGSLQWRPPSEESGDRGHGPIYTLRPQGDGGGQRRLHHPHLHLHHPHRHGRRVYLARSSEIFPSPKGLSFSLNRGVSNLTVLATPWSSSWPNLDVAPASADQHLHGRTFYIIVYTLRHLLSQLKHSFIIVVDSRCVLIPLLKGIQYWPFLVTF